MIYLDSYQKQHSTVFSIYSDKDEIDTSPDYQRHGDIWTLEKKQLLIDSIINRYDIPKIYFHKLSEDSKKEFAIVDGRQRLETIWKFIDGDFALNENFTYLRDSKVNLSGMTYQDIAKEYPKIKNKFDATSLPIIVIQTDDIELIDDMFSRLNEAVPLNAAEKRNAKRGFCIKAVNELSNNKFFKSRIKFNDNRYQHREVAIRLMFIEYCLTFRNGKIIDTKKVYLDDFAETYRRKGKEKINNTKIKVEQILDPLHSVFIDKDNLLSSQSIVPIYYLVAKELLKTNKKMFSRTKLVEFIKLRKKNRILAEKNFAKANFELLEFDRMSQQGTNDASSIRERTRILLDYLKGQKFNIKA